jgi:hypothetical protein
MLKKFFHTSLIVLSIFLFVAICVSQPIVLPFLIGGVITQGILGGFSGKVGPVVGANWRGIDYERGYKVPKYTRTTGQATQRDKFAVAIALARQILGNVISNYWNPFAVKVSGFNNVVKEFLDTMDVTNKLVIATKLCKGTLEGLGTLTCTYATGTGVCNFSWTNSSPVGNGLDTDALFGVVYDKSTQTFYVQALTQTRADAGTVGTVPLGLTATNLIAYVWAVQGTGANMICSDSSSDVAAAP